MSSGLFTRPKNLEENIPLVFYNKKHLLENGSHTKHAKKVKTLSISLHRWSSSTIFDSFENKHIQECFHVCKTKSETTPKDPIKKITQIPKPPSMNDLRLGGKTC